MTEPFDSIKKTSKGRFKDKDGQWEQPREFEYSPNAQVMARREEKRLASIKPTKIQSILSWISNLLNGPRYTMTSNKGFVFLLDQMTGETWYSQVSKSETYGTSYGAPPKWVKMKGYR